MNAPINSVGDSAGWSKLPYVVSVERMMKSPFKDMREALRYTLSGGNKDGLTTASQLLAAGDVDGESRGFSRPVGIDTRLGWNDAINCLYQFCEDDDIVAPLFEHDGGGSRNGMGMIYHDMIEKHQQILWLSFGVPAYSGAFNFLSNAVDSNLARYMRTGRSGIFSNIINTILVSGSTVIKIPFIAAGWLASIVSGENPFNKASRYYDFKATMTLYYQFVNQIVIELATNLGFIDSWFNDPKSLNGNPDKKDVPAHAPIIVEKGLLDTFKLMQQRGAFRFVGKNASILNLDKVLESYQSNDLSRSYDEAAKEFEQKVLNESTAKAQGISSDTEGSEMTEREKGEAIAKLSDSVSTSFLQGIKNTAFGALSYVGFRIEKGTDVSESWSNRTGESGLSQAWNGIVSTATEASFIRSGIASSLDIGGVMSFLGDLGSSVANAVGGGTLASTFAGGCWIDIPDVYQGSDFSASYSFDMELVAADGSNMTIFQDLFYPLAFLLAGALPRATGKNSYTNPFYCRAYCAGRFAVPLGMITELSVTRGDSEFGWNLNKLPTKLSVNMTIKDMAPAMYMSMIKGEGLGKIIELLTENNSFREYMMTLSGLDIADRTLRLKTLGRRISVLSQVTKNTYFNPLWWSMKIGESAPVRTFASFLPIDALPR